jgi:thioredoxin reductase (NADPH)
MIKGMVYEDLIIIGAGPAGLSAAQYGARANLKTLILEQLAPGGQALFIDVLENYPGIIPGKTGFEFCRDMHRQAEEFGAVFLTQGAAALEREGRFFTVTLGNGEKRRAAAVIIASGAKHRTLDIPGEADFTGQGVSYCAVCDGPFFKNKKIFVVGGGDAACDEAQYLSRLSSRVVLVHRRDKFRAQKALVERVSRNPHVEIRLNTVIKEIRGEQKVSSLVLEQTGSGKTYEEAADGVFIFTGIIPQSFLMPELEKDENGYIITDQRMAASVAGVFAAGDVRASPFRQAVVAAAEGAVAAHSAAAYRETLDLSNP